MIRLRPALLLALSCASAQGYASPPPTLDKLEVLHGLENGLWHWRVTSTPRQPLVPERDAQQCVDIARHMTQFLDSLQQHASTCRIHIDANTPEQARLRSQCPALSPVPGVTLPPMQIQYRILREGSQSVRVDAKIPNPLGFGNVNVSGQADRVGPCSAP